MTASWSFTDATILRPGAPGCEGRDRMEPGTLSFAEGRILAGPEDTRHRIDARGLWVLPGLIDLHGDGFERHVAPRRGMVTSIATALGAVQEELAACGITTAWLAQFWSWEGGMRAPAFMQRLACGLRDFGPEMRLDLRLQLRLETHMTEDLEPVSQLIRDHHIGYTVFNDHLPHDRLRDGRKPPRLNGSALKAGRSPEAHLAEMHARAARAPEVEGFTTALAARFPAMRLGSHDDPDAQTRRLWAGRGADISEFPTTPEAAQAARDAGHAVIMGAPNVVRGNSHNRGGMAATDLIAEGLVDALASDYHYPALAQSAFALEDRGLMGFAEAWDMVSATPAAIMALSDRGALAPGQRADVVVIDPATRRALGTFADGRPVWLSGPLADRLA